MKKNMQLISYLYLQAKLRLAIFFHIFADKNELSCLLSHMYR